MHDTIPVTEVMVTDVTTAPPDSTVTEAAERIRDRDVSSIVVVREGAPVGIVTEGDFARQLCDRRDLGDARLEDVMSAPLTTIEPDAAVSDAADRLRTSDVEHLPIVDDGDLVGIVTAAELSYFIPQLLRPPITHESEPPKRVVRTDTQYERDDWTFEYHGADETTVSVGDVATFSKTVTEADVESFADVTGDTNRLHLEEPYAAETRFGRRIAHGVLALGLVSASLARLPGLTIYLSQEVSFRAPIDVDERVTARCEIVDDLGESKFRVATAVVDSDGAELLEGEAVVLVDDLPPADVLEEVPAD
ncbi:CBS domain-containing protein [Natrialbaceae archaeon AArc-T1-2]|uniref:CBS domain-containing protein n=1 Tax=Natrialbaceae archaeon AArc-T1-2 TaxID=3053904 RepID=UPI00255A9C11|nr:CBS domain-containing protein [Natrialbaceae archaeon AArc-T1-2]WIV67088.1 CBS domain-containing protein [Natrialbaceae archaeon AArc-T1-2]